MLALGMAFLSRPRLVLIDELSLGLAPVVVERLVEVVRRIRDQGTTVVVVEQSVNVALTLADEAYFMEKGEIRFHGPTAELLDRPDVLRSVFLEGAAAGRRRPGAGRHGAHGGSANRRHARRHGGSRGGPRGGHAERCRQGAATAAAGERRRRPCSRCAALTRSFGGIRAVDDVSLRGRAG